MQGVEILTSAQVVTGYATNWNAFWTTLLIVLGVCIVIGFERTIISTDWEPLMLWGAIGCIVGFILGDCVASALRLPINHETRYQITISDEVSLTEFYEHYEVIDQDGKIFTVREKTNE